MNKEKPWDRVFKRNIENAKEKHTDVNIELEKEWPGGERWVQRFIAPLLPEQAVSLEIGAGSGRISQWVVPLVNSAHLTDYSLFACDLLRKKFPSATVTQVEDCMLTGIPSSKVDLVYSVSVFGHLFEEQVYRYFAESFRVLVPGGGISIHLTHMANDVEHFVNAIPDKCDTQRNIFRYLHPDYASLLARHAGFEDIRIEKADNTRGYFLIARKPPSTSVST